MVEEVAWSRRAIRDYHAVIDYLSENWSDKEVSSFIRATERTVEYIVDHPKLFRKTSKRNVHEALITPHNLMYYHIAGKHVQVLMIWDTRQNPKRKKY